MYDPNKIDWRQTNNAGFWGPSVSYNTALAQYVILMNRTNGHNYNTEGHYASFARELDDPDGWSAPQKLTMEGGAPEPSDQLGWYPMAVGAYSLSGTDRHGTDKLNDRVAHRSSTP